MKSLRVILSIAIPAALLLADASAVSANTLDGKCCGYGNFCLWYSNELGYGAYGSNACHTAKAQCLRTGIYVGPFSSRRFREMPRI